MVHFPTRFVHSSSELKMATEAAPLYEYSIVPFVRSMKNLVHVMDKAEQHAKDKGENVEDYTKLKIYPDMKEYVLQC